MPMVLPGALAAVLALAEPGEPSEPSTPSEPSELPVVTTDRPDATNGTFTVAPGVWQLEGGLDATLPPGRSDPDVPPLSVPFTLRIGLGERAELRLVEGDLQPFFDPSNPRGDGFGVGAKLRLLDNPPGRRRPSLGLQPFVFLPTFHPGTWLGTRLGVVGLWTQTVAEWLSIDFNASIELGLPSGEPLGLDSLFSASAQITKSERVLPYAELFTLVDWRDPASTTFTADAGLVMIVQRRISFDLAGRADVIAERRQYGVMAGISVILADGIRWRARRALRRGS